MWTKKKFEQFLLDLSSSDAETKELALLRIHQVHFVNVRLRIQVASVLERNIESALERDSFDDCLPSFRCLIALAGQCKRAVSMSSNTLKLMLTNVPRDEQEGRAQELLEFEMECGEHMLFDRLYVRTFEHFNSLAASHELSSVLRLRLRNMATWNKKLGAKFILLLLEYFGRSSESEERYPYGVKFTRRVLSQAAMESGAVLERLLEYTKASQNTFAFRSAIQYLGTVARVRKESLQLAEARIRELLVSVSESKQLESLAKSLQEVALGYLDSPNPDLERARSIKNEFSRLALLKAGSSSARVLRRCASAIKV